MNHAVRTVSVKRLRLAHISCSRGASVHFQQVVKTELVPLGRLHCSAVTLARKGGSQSGSRSLQQYSTHWHAKQRGLLLKGFEQYTVAHTMARKAKASKARGGGAAHVDSTDAVLW
jgi:hypothetical protein